MVVVTHGAMNGTHGHDVDGEVHGQKSVCAGTQNERAKLMDGTG